MRPEAFVVGLLLATFLLPGSAADDGCENHGTIVSAGLGNRYACTPDDGTCENAGAIVLVGGTYACPGGECVNRGLVVGALATYCDETGAFACWGRACARVEGGTLEASLPVAPDAGL